MHAHSPTATVVVPTRDRPAELKRCVEALRGQQTRFDFELVVVDDGSQPPVQLDATDAAGVPVRVVRSGGVGPARARNAGVEHAAGRFVLFTDDDTVPCSTWVDEACAFLESHDAHIGVEGPTTSVPYDRLLFHSVQAASPGSYLTCNIAYRRSVLIELGGFSDAFPTAHAEDLDLGMRAALRGPIGYAPRMTVHHPPRAVSLIGQIRRGRDLVSDVRLFRRHPDRFPAARYVTAPGLALALTLKHWIYSAVRDTYAIGRNPRRALRFAALAIGYTTVGVHALLRDAARRR